MANITDAAPDDPLELRQAIMKLAERGREVMIVGRGGMMVLQDVPGVLQLRVTVSEQQSHVRNG